MVRSRDIGVAVAFASVLAMLVPAAASGAATYVSVQNPSAMIVRDNDGGTPDPVTNEVTISHVGPDFLIADPNEVAPATTPSNVCAPVSQTQVSCAAAGISSLIGALGAGDDRITFLDPVGSTESVDLGEGNDFFQGSPGGDGAAGGPGDDRISLGAGDDQPCCTRGADGGPGNDQIDAGPGDDFGHGGPGNDSVDGGEGFDTVFGSEGNDTVAGGPGDDQIDVSGLVSAPDGGDDTLLGGDGNDEILATAGNDTADGGPGSDLLFSTLGADILNGGADRDFIDLRSDQPATADAGDGDDQIDSWFNGGVGDQIVCGPGVDSINLGPNDTVDSDCETVFDVIGCETPKCTGEVTLSARPPAARAAPRLRRAAAKPKPIVLGSAEFKVFRGHLEQVDIRLARRPVKKALKHRQTAKVTKKLVLEGRRAETPIARAQRTKTKFVLAK